MVREIITQALGYAGIAMLLILLGLGENLAMQAIAFFKAKAAGLKDENFQKLVCNALNTAAYLAKVTVSAIEQTTAGTLRTEVKAGIKDKAELEALGKQAVQIVIKQLTPEYYSALEASVADVEQYITDLVESKVLEMKNG